MADAAFGRHLCVAGCWTVGWMPRGSPAARVGWRLPGVGEMPPRSCQGAKGKWCSSCLSPGVLRRYLCLGSGRAHIWQVEFREVVTCLRPQGCLMAELGERAKVHVILCPFIFSPYCPTFQRGIKLKSCPSSSWTPLPYTSF